MNTSLNKLKSMTDIATKFPGAAHGDDIFYLFKTMFGADVSIESKEFAAVKRMISIYTNFATTGDPNVPELEENVHWDSTKSDKLPIKGMIFRADENSIEELPENERLAVWNEIYEMENCTLY